MNLTKHAAVTDAGTSVTSPTGLAGLPQQLGDALRSALRGPNPIRDRSIDPLAFAHAASPYSLIPLAVVVPRDAAEVGRLLAVSAAQGAPLTFRAGGTSLSGQSSSSGVLGSCRSHFDA